MIKITTEELKVIISAETSKYEQGIKKITNSTNAFSKIAKVAFGGVTAKLLIDLGKKCIQVASDLEEVQNVVDVAFGNMKQDAEDFASTAIKQFGITELQAKQVSSTYMAMGTSLGLIGEDAKNAALSLTGLAADVSSFYNVSLEEAQTALKGIYTGETESLKRYGVVLTEATLEQYRLSKGIQTSYRNMSQADKVALRYNYTLQALSNAQGDYQRTSGSWANQTRLLKNQLTDLMGSLGVILKSFLQPILIVVNKILSGVAFVLKVIARAFKTDLSEGTSGVVNNMDSFGGSISEAQKGAEKLKRTVAGFDELNTLSPKNTGTAEDAAIGGGLGIDIPSFELDTGDTSNTIDKIGQKIQEVLPIVLVFIGTLLMIWGFFTGNIASFAIGAGMAGAGISLGNDTGFWANLASSLSDTWNGFTDGVKNAWNNCKEFINTRIDNIKDRWRTRVDNIKEDWNNCVENIKTRWSNGVEKLKERGQNLKTSLSTSWDGLKTGVGNAIQFCNDKIEGFRNNVREKFRNIGNTVISNIERTVNNIVNKFNNTGLIRGINKILGTSIALPNVAIPRLAKGGVLTTPTVALMGEYVGAKNNPEIAAPQSILQEIINTSNGQLASVFAQCTQQLIRAIQEKDMEVKIDDTTIAKSAARGNNAYKLRTGMGLI